MHEVGLEWLMFYTLLYTSVVDHHLKRLESRAALQESNIIKCMPATEDDFITMDTSEEPSQSSSILGSTPDRIIIGVDYGTTGTGKILNRDSMKQ